MWKLEELLGNDCPEESAPVLREPVVRPEIVLVDDNASVVDALSVVLRSRYNVHGYIDGESGVARVRVQVPDLVISDIKMPIRDGFWVYEQIRKLDPRVPIIFHSAYTEMGQSVDVATNYQPFAYVDKGATVGDFMKLIGRAVLYGVEQKKK